MEKIMNKIKNLLDLANNNPNENEAIAAALKAQELMAKYNIELEQLDDKKENREIVKMIYEDDGKHTMKKWKYGLGAIIAKNFRCKMYLLDRSNLVFYGYKEDATIALQVFTYLYEIGNKFAFREYYKIKKAGHSTKGVMNTYLVGFREGIRTHLEKQCTALMLVTPREITENYQKMMMGAKTVVHKLNVKHDSKLYKKGIADGRAVASARELETAV